jgi:hypothetical protein
MNLKNNNREQSKLNLLTPQTNQCSNLSYYKSGENFCLFILNKQINYSQVVQLFFTSIVHYC